MGVPVQKTADWTYICLTLGPSLVSLCLPLVPVVTELSRRVQGCSPLGDYQAPLQCLRQLVDQEAVAKALVSLPSFLPNLKQYTGRAVELPGSSWFGPCFSVSPVPDQLVPAVPNVREACFDGLAGGSRRQVGDRPGNEEEMGVWLM
jgi:hypothetical protein